LTGAERRQLAADDGDEGLAQRTRVLVLAADGASNPDIAEKVAMTEATVAVGGRGSWPRGWPV
jgi:DNA-binding NarL/FixJ family response regulator